MRRLEAMSRVGTALTGRRSLRRLAIRPRLRRAMLGRIVEHAERFTPEETVQILADMAGCTVVDELLRGTVVDGPIHAFTDLPCPVRIAWVQYDRVLPFRAYGIPMLAAVPGAQLVALPGAGHVPMIDDPDLIMRTILEPVAGDVSDRHPRRA